MVKPMLAFAVCGLAVGAWASQIEFDFSKDNLGGTPPGFLSTAAGGGDVAKWTVALEQVAPVLAPIETNSPGLNTERPVLKPLSFDMGEKHAVIFLFTNEIFDDFIWTTRFKISGGVVEPSAGLVFRAQDAKNFYVVRASAEGNLLWYKVVGGQAYEARGIGVKLPMPRDQWRELRIECSGSQIRCYLDGLLAIPPARPGAPTNDLAINDTTFERGKIGFWSKADTRCCFVDAHVQYTPHVPYLQVVVDNIRKKHPKLLGLEVYAGKSQGLPVVVGGLNESQMGEPGTKVEQDVIERGVIYFLKDSRKVEVTMPLRDRNGEVIAAIKIKMKTFIGETQNTAVDRAAAVKREIEMQIGNMQDING